MAVSVVQHEMYFTLNTGTGDDLTSKGIEEKYKRKVLRPFITLTNT